MNAVRPCLEPVLDDQPAKSGATGKLVRVKDLLTKYFYRDEHLCFQLLVLAESGEKILFKEFTNYGECRRALDELQQMKSGVAAIRLPEKKSTWNSPPKKWHGF